MNATKESVLKAALKLSVEERAELVDDLVISMHPKGPPGADVDWDAEIERRCREIDEGTAKLVPWEEVKAMLRKERQHLIKDIEP